jgi:hypothetical protein
MSLNTRATTIAAASAQAGAALDPTARTPAAVALRPLLGFLDEAQRVPDELLIALLREAPAPTGSRQLDAFVSALAEHVALKRGVTPPEWTQDPTRFLDQWWFPSGFRSLHATALVESPTAFRRRGIFITAGALERC